MMMISVWENDEDWQTGEKVEVDYDQSVKEEEDVTTSWHHWHSLVYLTSISHNKISALWTNEKDSLFCAVDRDTINSQLNVYTY